MTKPRYYVEITYTNEVVYTTYFETLKEIEDFIFLEGDHVLEYTIEENT